MTSYSKKFLESMVNQNDIRNKRSPNSISRGMSVNSKETKLDIGKQRIYPKDIEPEGTSGTINQTGAVM
jgi:hypothetical protein